MIPLDSDLTQLFGGLSVPRTVAPKIAADSANWAPRTSGGGTGYLGAAYSRRWKQFQAIDEGPNRLLMFEGETLRERSRQLVRGFPWASSAEDAIAASLVGTGIRPRFSSRSSLPDAQREAVMDLWEEWIEQCDATGASDFYGLQEIVARSRWRDGEILARLRSRRADDRLPVPLQIQLIEADQLPYRLNAEAEQDNIVAGIEINKIGRPIAYHLLKEHPRDGRHLSAFRLNTDTVRVPASDVLHIFSPRRAGQLRGEPRAAAAITAMYQLMQYGGAELDRKVLAAAIFGVAHNTVGTDYPVSSDHGDTGVVDADGTLDVSLEMNTIVDLGDKEVQFTKMDDLPDAYRDFFSQKGHEIASALGITYEQMSGDYEKVTFSSARGAVMEARRRFRQDQKRLTHQFNRRAWEAFIDSAFLSGRLSDRRFPANRSEYMWVLWQPERWDYVNPVDDVKAEVMEMNAGLVARDQKIVERGGDPVEVDKQAGDGRKRAAKLGAVYPELEGKPAAGRPQQGQLDFGDDPAEAGATVQ